MRGEGLKQTASPFSRIYDDVLPLSPSQGQKLSAFMLFALVGLKAIVSCFQLRALHFSAVYGVKSPCRRSAASLQVYSLPLYLRLLSLLLRSSPLPVMTFSLVRLKYIFAHMLFLVLIEGWLWGFQKPWTASQRVNESTLNDTRYHFFFFFLFVTIQSLRPFISVCWQLHSPYQPSRLICLDMSSTDHGSQRWC